MKPTPGTKFTRREAEVIVTGIIKAQIGDKPYVHADSLQLSKDISAAILAAIHDLDWVRSKLVVQVFIAEACNQGMRISSRCLWDPETDGFAEITHSSETMHVTAVVFGLYWE